MARADFKQNTMVAFKNDDGSEILVRFLSYAPGDNALVQVNDGRPVAVPENRLLSQKTPFFDVRGLVATTSAAHSGEVGEIVALGRTAAGNRAFKVLFNSDNSTEWFTEDQVFIEDRPEDESVLYGRVRSV